MNHFKLWRLIVRKCEWIWCSNEAQHCLSSGQKFDPALSQIKCNAGSADKNAWIYKSQHLCKVWKPTHVCQCRGGSAWQWVWSRDHPGRGQHDDPSYWAEAYACGDTAQYAIPLFQTTSSWPSAEAYVRFVSFPPRQFLSHHSSPTVILDPDNGPFRNCQSW